MSVEVLLTGPAREDLNDLPVAILRRANHVLERLERWPQVSGAKPLTGSLAGRYRMRTGDYRVQFYVDGKRLIVERVGHRAKFYER